MELHSRRRMGRPGTGSLICSLDLVHRGVESLGQFFGDIFPQPRMPSLDGSQSGRGHSNLLGQLRLRQTSKNPEVSQISLIPRDEHYVIHGDTENVDDPSKVVDLRGSLAHFPTQHSSGTYLCKSPELPPGELFRLTCNFQRSGRKPPQDSSAHSSHPHMSHHFA